MSTFRSCYQADVLPRRPATSLAVLFLALLLSSCASVGPQQPAAEPDIQPITETADVIDRTIANDIVKIATQIFTPFNTTLQFNTTDNDPLMQYFVTEFARAGYGIQRVSADQGSNFFNYERREESTESGDTLVRFDATIGAVDIGRDYTIPSMNMVAPASPVRLMGTRVPVEVTDVQSARMRVENEEFSRATYAMSLNLDEQAPPVISLITNDLVNRVANQASGQAINSDRIEVNNLFYADQSNFTSILDDYEQVERQIVVFGNDSMVLGATNKLLIEQLVQERLGPNDIISLVGCSNGPTALEIGNEGLALGRAERVTEALMSQGVPRDQILDEGCWAPVSAGDKFPSRGVVMEVWRSAS